MDIFSINCLQNFQAKTKATHYDVTQMNSNPNVLITHIPIQQDIRY